MTDPSGLEPLAGPAVAPGDLAAALVLIDPGFRGLLRNHGKNPEPINIGPTV
jgi:hypothetical protein